MTQPNLPWGDLPLGFDATNVQVEEHVIGGKMVTIRSEIGANNLVHIDDETWRQTIRSELAHKLATFILQTGLCEITTMQTPHSLSRTVAIRCYLAPDDQVKILRIHKA